MSSSSECVASTARRQVRAAPAYHARMAPSTKLPLRGMCIAITQPVGAGRAFARRVRALGGTPLSLPGSRLLAAIDPKRARADLRAALATDIVIFTSPAAVRFARALAPLRTRARVLAPGSGTLRALQRAGIAHAIAPAREDSEGLLALPQLAAVRRLRIAIIGAPGGRGLLAAELAARGAHVSHAHVYQRVPARLDRRHVAALLHTPNAPLCMLLSSSEALANILATLPASARAHLLEGVAVASSARLAAAARTAGFGRIVCAASPRAEAMLAAVLQQPS